MEIPELTEKEIEEGLALAKNSPRHRNPKILHDKGDEFNRAINFVYSGSYMRPHLHPGKEKIEDIYLMKGKMALVFFDDQGNVIKSAFLEKGKKEFIEIPAFTWHTYVIFSEYTMSYETMMGVYDPATYKSFPNWAPAENTPESVPYLAFLKEEAIKKEG